MRAAARTRLAQARTLAQARVLVPVAQRRPYTGGLTDKDRIFTNLYNDTSPWLEDAKKRVRRRAVVHRACVPPHRPPTLVDSGLR